MTQEDFDKCVYQICENLNVPSFEFISAVPADNEDIQVVFCSLRSAGESTFHKIEIKKNEDYRKLRALIKTRLISSLLDIRNLAEETLKQLGYV